MKSAQQPSPHDLVGRLLQDTEPRARCVPEAEVRRAVKRHQKLAGPAFLVPHGYGAVLPDAVLVAEPPEEVAEGAAGAQARWVWERLFELRLEAAVSERIASGALSPEALRQRFQRIGVAEGDEVRVVLREQRRLLPPRAGEPADAPVYAAFVAAFCRLQRFDPQRLERWFPGLRGRVAEIAALVARDGGVATPDKGPDAGADQGTQPSKDTGVKPGTDAGGKPGDTDDKDGCECNASTGGGQGEALGLLLMAALLFLRRRRRRP